MPKILIIAGEASGDLLGAHLCQSIIAQDPSVKFFGMGGTLMQKAGVDIRINSDALAVVGILEVIKHFSKIRQAFKTIKNAIKQEKPDLVVLIDYPGFNLRIAKFAKQNNCKVFFYVSPQIWAWRYHRIHHIKKYVDHMAVLFAFEEKLYQRENIPVSFVGHPITDIAKPSISIDAAYQQFNLDPNKPVVALFPGSRKQEILRMLPTIVEAVALIHKKLPDAQFILPLASSLKANELAPYLPKNIALIKNNTYNVLSIANAAIAVSGTVTLEIALQRVPFLILYKVSAISFWLAKRLVKIPYIGLCNLVAEMRVAKELIQKDANAQLIAEETVRLITDDDYRQSILTQLNKVKANLGLNNASQRTANAVLDLLKPN
jgi:lipid-A-disaccharide synthase